MNKQRKRKSKQMNVRWDSSQIEAIAAIAELEDRDFSYVVRYFVSKGIEFFKEVHSLREYERAFNARRMRTKTESNAKARLELREEATFLNGKQERRAAGPQIARKFEAKA